MNDKIVSPVMTIWVWILAGATVIPLFMLFWGVGLACEFLFAPFLYMGCGVLGLIATLVLALLPLIRNKRITSKMLMGICVAGLCSLITFVGFFFIPRWRNDLQFALLPSEYEQVVALVQSRQLPVTDSLATLPVRYSYLTACNGRIGVDYQSGSTVIMFITYRGILREVGGYLYRADDLPPQPEDLGAIRNHGRWDTIHPLRPHWFYVYRD